MKKNHSDYSNSDLKIDQYDRDSTLFSVNQNSSRSPQRRRRKRQRKMVLILLAVILLIVAGIIVLPPLLSSPQPSETTTPKTTQSSITRQTGSDSTTTVQTTTEQTTTAATTTRPTISAATRQTWLADTGAAVESLLGTYPGRYAVYYQNLATGDIYQFQDDQPFVAASSIKLGINTYLYTKIESGEIDPAEMLTFDNRAYPTGDYEGGTGTIQGMANGTQISVRDTSGYSIRISDNCGTNMVIRRLGGIDAINPYLSSISGVVDYRQSVSYTTYNGSAASGKHRTCARDLGLQAVYLYRLWQNNPAVYQPLIDDLCQTEFDFGIQKGIPADLKVAHKIGTNGLYATENDVGIVLSGDEPFVLCVMTESGSAEQAHQIQADIAKKFYDLYVRLSSNSGQ